MNDTPYTAIGDEPVEARIVAWVLGEASAFEVAELERLCAERPELLIFRRRMLALHGLLTAAEAAQPDDDWKLPPDKRKVLDEIFGAEAITRMDSRKERGIRHSGRRALFAIAACLILALVVLQLVHPTWVHQVVRIAEKRVDFMPGGTGAGESDGNQFGRLSELSGGTLRVHGGAQSADTEQSSKRGAPLTTTLPSELIEGTPKPMLFSGGHGLVQAQPTMPAKERSLGLDKERMAKNEELASSRRELKEQPQIVEGQITASSASTLSAPPAVTTAPAAAPQPAADHAAKDRYSRTESRVDALSSLASSDQPQHRRTSDLGDLEQGRLADAKRSPAAKPPATPAQMPVLGKRFAENSKEENREESGQAMGYGGSAGGILAANGLQAADEKPASLALKAAGEKSDASDGSERARVRADHDWRISKPEGATNQGNRSGTEDELQAGIPSEYSFKVKKLENQSADLSGLSQNAKELNKAIRAQEDKLEDRRKVLSTIVRTKGIIYKGSDSFYGQTGVDEDQGARAALQTEMMKDSTREDAIKRGLDAQDYVDAKRDFEQDQEILQTLKLKQKELSAAPETAKPMTQPDPPKLAEESAAADDPYSTFSLNISDASFQVAQAALAKGERPDPAGIKVEQFYNAVDYGDPSPAAGEPVAVAIEQAVHPVIPGRNLVRVALKTAADGRAASQPLRLTLLVDQSGSMVRDDRRAAMDKALSSLAGLLTPNDLVTVIGFARTPRLLADGWTGTQAAKLNELVNQAASEGGTNLEEALKLAEVMADRRKLAGAQNRIVLFTDGAVNLGDADPAHLAARVKALRQKGLAFDIAGIAADDLNDELLGELACNGNGRYYVVGKGADDGFARQLAGAFRPAAENVKVQVHFNPERVGHYQLIGYEKDRLHTEDFRNDAVDAAELAADEAGVAVYQVEPLPGGSGELGEVSVRFRDAASAQMVERTWTIPYDASAPAIDRATPSMQLAVLAMLAAEKLRGGPLAAAIDFKQLAAPRANVKRCFGNNGRVAEVLNMLNSL